MAEKVQSTGVKIAASAAGGAENHGILKNGILRALPRKELTLLLSKCEMVSLPARTILSEIGKPIESAYFVNGGVVSIVNVLSDGKSVEVGLTGREGFVGLPLIVGYSSSPTRAVVQIAVEAYKIRSQHLQTILRRSPKLLESLQRYSQELSIQAIQIAACNRLHEVEERLARWLLMSQDRMGAPTFPLTQEFISHMLGTRRASVTVAAGILQKAGLIEYRRGQVTIEDRSGLEEASCECYKGINDQVKRWRNESE